MLVYAALGLIVAISLFDLHSLSLRGPANTPAPIEVPTSDAGWPQLRGPAYDGRSGETELADAWPEQGPPLLWMKEVGAGYSGLIAHGGRVYTQAQGLTEQRVLALDADTGRTIWERGYSWPYQPGGMFPGPRATPTWSGGRLYYAAPNGLVGCMSAADGRPLWSVNVLQQFDGRGIGFGYACSPVVEDGKVILPVGGQSASVVALDADTGGTRWAAGGAPASYCSALPITFRGRRQVAVFLRDTLAGIDLETGRLLWEHTYARAYEEHAAALLYEEPYLRAMQAYRAGSDLYVLEPGAPESTADGVPGCQVRRVRHDAEMSNDVASSVLVNGFVYGFDLRDQQASGGRPSRGTFRCMEFKTGQVRWSSDRPGQAAMVVAEGKLLMLNDRGQVLLVRANPDRYEELRRAEVFTGETCWTAPALYRGRLYLRSPTRAACIFVGKPERMSPAQRALAATSAGTPRPAPADLTWLVGARREYPFEMPDLRELTPWYLFSLGALAVAGLCSAATYAASGICCGTRSRRAAAVVFWGGILVFGIAATPLANRCWKSFVFTWPLSLIAVHQIALAGVFWSSRRDQAKGTSWIGLAGAVLLLVTCLLYFKITRQLSLAPAWYFLLVLPVTWPLALPAARALYRSINTLAGDILWMFAVFTVYFWAAGGVMMLRTALL